MDKLKFSVLDAVIVLVVLVAGLGVFMFLGMDGGGEPVVVEFEVEFRGMHTNFVDYPRIGDRIYDSVRGHFLGYITAVRYEDATAFGFDHQGRIFREQLIPDQIDVFLSVRADGYESDDRIIVAGDDVEVRVGTQMFVRGRGFAHEGFNVSLTTRPR